MPLALEELTEKNPDQHTDCCNSKRPQRNLMNPLLWKALCAGRKRPDRFQGTKCDEEQRKYFGWAENSDGPLPQGV